MMRRVFQVILPEGLRRNKPVADHLVATQGWRGGGEEMVVANMWEDLVYLAVATTEQ